MKCPKCHYLGFETTNRCRHCGYDFSLLPIEDFHAPDPGDARTAPAPEPVLRLEPAPPLSPPPPEADEPLVRLPAAPRPPLAVRRAPEARRVRAPSGRPAVRDAVPLLDIAVRTPASEIEVDRGPSVASPVAHAGATITLRRLTAVLLDHGLLFGIDATVFYLTLRMVSLPASEWRAVAAPSMLVFLGMVKLAYFWAFTAACGQTIGKMATRIRVVAEDGVAVDPSKAVWRTLAAVASVGTLGAAFAPALFGQEGLALHDRLARTRVIRWPA